MTNQAQETRKGTQPTAFQTEPERWQPSRKPQRTERDQIDRWLMLADITLACPPKDGAL